MRKILLLIILLQLCVANMMGLNPDKEVISNIFPDGTTAFVKPRKMPKVKDSAAIKPMEYDVTMSTVTDSVSVTGTVVTGISPLATDSVVINDEIVFPIERIYVEPKSGKWVNRVRFYMPNDSFINSFCGESPLKVSFGECVFELSEKKLKEESVVYKRALEIIKMNKR